MQEITIVTKIDNQQAINAQVGLRKEIKNLKLELEGLNEGTQEYNSTFMKLSNAMKEQKDRMAALRNSSADLGDVIGNTTKLAGGLVGGFQAAQGAISLFGGAGEDLMPILIKLQSLMAITSGLAQFEELTKVIPNLKNNFKGMFNTVSKEASGTADIVSAIANSFDAAGDAAVVFTNRANTEALNKSLGTTKSYVDDLSILIKGSGNGISVTSKVIGDNIEKTRTFVNAEGDVIKKQVELWSSSNKLMSINLKDYSLLNKTIEVTSIRYDELGKEIDVTKVITDNEGKVIEKITGSLDENTKALTLGKAKIFEWAAEHKKALLIGGLVTVVVAAIAYGIYKLNEAYQNSVEKIKLMADINATANKSIAEQSLNLEILVGSFNKLKTVSEKTKYVKEYGDVIDEAAGKTLTLKQREDFLSDKSQIERVKTALFEKAKAQAVYSKIIELQSKLLDEQAKAEETRMAQQKGNWFVKQWSRFVGTGYSDIIKYQKQIDTLKSTFDLKPTLEKNTSKPKTPDNNVAYTTKTYEDLNKIFITFKDQNAKVRRDWIAGEELDNEKRYENLKRTQSGNYEALYVGTKNYLEMKQALNDLKAQEELDKVNEDAKKLLDTQTANLENNIKAIDTNLLKGKGLTAKDRENEIALKAKYEAEKATLTDNYNTTILNNTDKFKASINNNEKENYTDSLKNTTDYYSNLIKEIDKNSEVLSNKTSIIFNDVKSNFANKQDVNLLSTWFNFNPNELEKQLAEITNKITEAQNNIKEGTSNKDILNKELNDILTTAERRKEIEVELTKIKKEQSDARLIIDEAEAEKRKAINENIIAISESSMQATSSLFQSVIDNNDASYAEAENRYKQQLEDGLITKDQYDKKLLAAQQKQNEKNKKWQAGIAMIDGLSGAVKAVSGAMSLGPIAGPIVGGIEAAAIMASTVASIRKIYAEKVSDSGSGGSVSSSSVSSITSPLVYSTNVTTQTQEQQLNQATKVYVLESDITNTQNKVKVVQNESTF